MGLTLKSLDKANKEFTLSVDSIPSKVTVYPVTVRTTLEDGTVVEKTKNVSIKVTPTVSITGADSFVAKAGKGSADYTFTYTPSTYNVDVILKSVTSSNTLLEVSNATKDGFTLSASGTSADVSSTITAVLTVDGTDIALTKSVTATYMEDNGPFILYNYGTEATVSLKRSSTSVPMTQMYYAVVSDYTEGEDYDDSAVTYSVYENTGTTAVTIASVPKGSALLLKAVTKARWSTDSSVCTVFSITDGAFKAYGAIGSLDGYGTSMGTYCYYYMFAGCTGLVKAPDLPATTLERGCYQGMFARCSSLTQVPELPATTLASYCYREMFQNCTLLYKAQSTLPATKLVDHCYTYMFQNCSKLNAAPQILAETLASNCCYYMFSSCTSLTQAPALPATTLASYCYFNMFKSCTSLKQAPALPATTLESYCYYYMFSACAKLNYVKALFTTEPPLSCTSNWLYNVASTGTFVKNSAATWDVTGVNGVPEGWTIEYATE